MVIIMKINLLLSLVVLAQSRLMYSGNLKGFSKSSETSMLDGISGIFAGMKIDAPPLTTSLCLADLEKISSELFMIKDFLKNPSFRSLFKILRQVEQALVDLPKTLGDCFDELNLSAARLDSGLRAIRYPKLAVYQEHSSLKINGVEVFEDINMIQEKMLQQKWFDAGFVIGNVLSKLSAASEDN